MSGTYDRIARFYDVDMALNMAFDDVGFYAGVCRTRPGPSLELGCGNGRILLELLARGIDGVGVDASAGMLRDLQRRAAALAITAPVCRMDVRALAFRPGFGVILCPYSLITYLTTDDDVTRLIEGVRDLLAPGGLLVVDAFIPRPIVDIVEFRRDYRRPYGENFLVRSKRIHAVGEGLNRIERRYQVVTAGEEVLEQIDVIENIRPFSPDALCDRLVAAGFAVDQTWWDYTRQAAYPEAQFFTLVASVRQRAD